MCEVMAVHAMANYTASIHVCEHIHALTQTKTNQRTTSNTFTVCGVLMQKLSNCPRVEQKINKLCIQNSGAVHTHTQHETGRELVWY